MSQLFVHLMGASTVLELNCGVYSVKYQGQILIKNLCLVDHTCGPANGACASSPANNPLLGSLPKAGDFPPFGAHGTFQPIPAPVPAPLSGWMSNPPTVTHFAVSGALIALGAQPIPASLKQPRNPRTNFSIDYSSGDFDHVAKRTRPIGIGEFACQFVVSIISNRHT